MGHELALVSGALRSTGAVYSTIAHVPHGGSGHRLTNLTTAVAE